MHDFLIIGEFREEADHPIYPVKDILYEIFQPYCQPEFIEARRCTPDVISKSKMMVLYNDTWEEPLSRELVASILDYTASGRTLLAIHCGIFYLQSNPEFLSLTAGRFYHHPPRCNMEYETAQNERFTLYEEPYLFRFTENVERNVFLIANYEGRFLPQGWSVQFGKGQFIYLAPGHDSKTFENTQYQNLLRSCINGEMRNH